MLELDRSGFVGLRLGLILALFALAAGARAAGEAWHYADRGYRREVLLPADAAAARTNAPVFLDLAQISQVDYRSVKVDEITAGGTAQACDAAAYAQISGRAPRAYWAASGTTAAGQQRRFLLYYNKTSTPPAYAYNWNRAGQTFGGSQVITPDGSKFYYTLAGDRLELKRGARNKLGGTNNPQRAAFYERNPSTGEDFTHLRDVKTGFSPLDGFRMNYAFLGAQYNDAVYFNVPEAEKSFDYLQFDRNGPTGSMAVRYTISEMMNHKTELAHRMFKGQPLLEYTISVTADSGQAIQFAQDLFHSRQFYWKSSFTPAKMNTDTGGDTSLSSGDAVRTWEMLYDSSDNALAIFTFKPASKRYQNSIKSLQDYYNLGEQDGSFFVYLAVGKRSEILPLLRTMKRGYPLGSEQRPLFDIAQPNPGARLIPGEKLLVVVEGPALGTSPQLTVQYPDKSTRTFSPTGGSATAKQFDLGTLTTNEKFGTWTLTAFSGSNTRSRTIEVSKPAHPCVIFTANELNQAKARWTTNPLYQSYIQKRLEYQVIADYKNPAPAQIGSSAPRDYGRALLHYASYLLMNPSQSTYRTRMWADFEAVINWKNWDPVGNQTAPFKMDDVVRGEMLQALACVYDWHYGDLSTANRRRYAEMLANYADRMIQLDYAGLYPVRWENYIWLVNNRYFLQNAGIAAVERAVRGEVPQARRDYWNKQLNYNFANVIKALPPDGTSNEGFSYNALGVTSLFVWTEARRLNGDTGVYGKSPWFAAESSYELYGMIPGRVGNYGGVIPFGNCETAPYMSQEMNMSLLSLRRGDSIAQWLAENTDYDRVEPFQPFWQRYNQTKADLATIPNWKYFPTMGIFVFRSSWNNDAMYLAIKCGAMWGGHEHPDMGTFILHRKGFPYFSAPLYLEKSGLEDENIVIVNGKGIRGRSTDNAYSSSVDPQYWGQTTKALGSPDYFNVLTNPAPAYEEGSNLTAFTREFVGFDDLVILRDQLKASASSTFKQLLHAQKTDPQTDPTEPYDPYQYPTDQVFFSQGTNWMRLYPNKTAAPNEYMTMLDLSGSSWTGAIQPYKLICKYVPGYLAEGVSRKTNNTDTSYQRGFQLARTATGTSVNSLQICHFRSDQYKARAWSTAVADAGTVIYYGTDTNNAKIKVVWPKAGSMGNVSGAEGLTVKGQMAMRNYETKAFGGRELTRLRDDSAQGEKVDLINAAAPLAVVANFAASGHDAWYVSSAAIKVTFYHPAKVRRTTVDGKVVSTQVNGKNLILTLPAAPNGAHLLTDDPNGADPAWTGYR